MAVRAAAIGSAVRLKVTRVLVDDCVNSESSVARIQADRACHIGLSHDSEVKGALTSKLQHAVGTVEDGSVRLQSLLVLKELRTRFFLRLIVPTAQPEPHAIL